ncbi:hypothetical protein VOLCADRAFT_106091 [Volvox carteri f. nagariensis]|uniref:Uncharacterized protein n=1 Tax=Volvox carteri f. nagariensis TaxID=3068 RepID=D8U508_VOLCA|nr:uncharacterized protein VOLCADRAFT_106091 [Volvox carteri f. nagariensis]EFJ45064.1 hypothetical protein VOLCADRAFT_106091 [Volvox carteri f. nagariensis]|eukprot:XP_002953740.1 hypothetical protein VOLCADRAFT_106091 [Volvox carteri f. nagariensis]
MNFFNKVKNLFFGGLDWYAASQIQDQHGDYANEFFDADTGTKCCAGAAATTVPAAAADSVRPKRGPHKPAGKAGGGSVAAGKQQLKVKDVQRGTVILEPI